MSRELKFRAWSTEYNRFLDCDCSQLSNYMLGYANPVARNQDWKTITVQQYIGLKDKNGVEIYEGDILKHKEKIEQVPSKLDWNCGCCGWVYGYFIESPDDIEVIGNIFENPELLKL